MFETFLIGAIIVGLIIAYRRRGSRNREGAEFDSAGLSSATTRRKFGGFFDGLGDGDDDGGDDGD